MTAVNPSLDPFAPGIVKLWDATTKTELYRLAGHESLCIGARPFVGPKVAGVG